MSPLARRKMLVKMDIAPSIPPISVLRAWAEIDNRKIPGGNADGEFASHIEWVNKASSWIGWTGALCYDVLDRPCRNGGDFDRAQTENAFPVRWYLPERFGPQVPVNRSTMAIRMALAKSEGVSDDDARAFKGWSRLQPKTIAKRMVTLGAKFNPDGRWRLNDVAKAELANDIERVAFASWVR